jgi:uncharacterized phiE125 gp8 family phage protein
MSIKILQQPIAEPVTLGECYDHLRIDPYLVGTDGTSHPDDELIMAYAAAARGHAERFTGLSLAVKLYELALDGFPVDKEIRLRNPPLVEVVAVEYVDPDLLVQTVPPDQYVIDNHATEDGAGWLVPAVGYSWPATANVINAVRVRYRAGYAVPGDGTDVEPLPYEARAAILLMLGQLYEHREDAMEKGLAAVPSRVHAMLRPLRVRIGMA